MTLWLSEPLAININPFFYQSSKQTPTLGIISSLDNPQFISICLQTNLRYYGVLLFLFFQQRILIKERLLVFVCFNIDMNFEYYWYKLYLTLIVKNILDTKWLEHYYIYPIQFLSFLIVSHIFIMANYLYLCKCWLWFLYDDRHEIWYNIVYFSIRFICKWKYIE